VITDFFFKKNIFYIQKIKLNKTRIYRTKNNWTV